MMDKKTRDKLIRILAMVQDAGQKWAREGNGCLRCAPIKNAEIADFLIEHGVGIASDNNVGSKTAEVSRMWLHESDRHGNRWSRCSICCGCVDGYVNHRYCPHCGNEMRR